MYQPSKGSGDRAAQFPGGPDPLLHDDFCPGHRLFVGGSVSHASRQFRDQNDIGLILFAPINDEFIPDLHLFLPNGVDFKKGGVSQRIRFPLSGPRTNPPPVTVLQQPGDSPIPGNRTPMEILQKGGKTGFHPGKTSLRTRRIHRSIQNFLCLRNERFLS